jgi:hypothetical protein
MPIVLADTGANAILLAAFNGQNLSMRLFVNNVTPTDASTIATFTEASGGGYAAKTLTGGSWTGSNVGGIEQVAYALQTWSFSSALTGNATIYGYYVTNAAGTVLWYADAQVPFTPTASGSDQYSVPPVYQLSKGTPT